MQGNNVADAGLCHQTSSLQRTNKRVSTSLRNGHQYSSGENTSFFPVYFLKYYSLNFLHSLVPAKMVLDWKLLFITGRPLYGDGSTGPVDALSSTITGSSDESRIYSTNDQLLNDIDFQQYKVNTIHMIATV